MKAIDTTASLLCAGALLIGGVALCAPFADAQTAQGQSQSDKIRQLQSQPPKIDLEWKAAVDFMQTHCPNRINFVLNQLQNRPIQFDHARELILKQYRQIANTKGDIHDMAVAQAEIQDRVFGALIEYRAAKARNDQRAMFDAQRKLRTAEELQVEVQISLRKLRIQRLQTEIEDFTKKKLTYAENWTKDELKRAATGEFDDGANRSGNAAIEDPPAPPAKK